MKTKISIFCLLSLSVLTFVSPVLAQTATPTPVPTKPGFFKNFLKDRIELRKNMRDNRKEVKQDLKENREVLKITDAATKKQFQINRLTTTQNGLYKSFTVRFANLQKAISLIKDKAAQKLVKHPDNQDLKNALTRLDSDGLKTLLANYNSDLAKYGTTIKTISSSSDPKSLLPQLKSEAKKINDDLKAIRVYLVDTLRLVVKAR